MNFVAYELRFPTCDPKGCKHFLANFIDRAAVKELNLNYHILDIW